MKCKSAEWILSSCHLALYVECSCALVYVTFTLALGRQQSSPAGSVVRTCLPMQKIHVQPLGREDPLEKEMATPSGILAWEIPWSLVGYHTWGHKELDITELLTLSHFLSKK